MDRISGRMKDINSKLALLRELDEQEREKVRRRIRRDHRKFMRANRQIDFGRVPPRARVELAERVSEFAVVVKSFELDDFKAYGDWRSDYFVACMNLSAFLEMLLRDYGVVKIQYLIKPAKMSEGKGGEIDGRSNRE